MDSSAFMGHGEIVMTHNGAAWIQDANVPVVTFDNWAAGFTRIEGSGQMVMPLQAPTRIGGVEYGLSDFYLCYQHWANSYIDYVDVFAPKGTTFDYVLVDETDRAGDQCDTFTVESAAPEGAAIRVNIVDPVGGGVSWLYSVHSTWTTAAAQS
jgi:hypothetical protein